MSRKHLFLIIGIYFSACLIYLAYSIAVTEAGFPLDDAWIHQVFARNLATGHGFSFNPDQPISGATAPLWSLLLAIFWPILGPIASGIILGLILELLAILAIYKLSDLLLNSSAAALMVAITSSITWVLVWGGLSGMEIGLYSALSLWGLYFYFKSEGVSSKYNFIAYAMFTLSILSRPECGLFLLAAILNDILNWLKAERKAFTPWIWRLVIIAIILTPDMLFNYSVAHSIFPRTYTAKVQGRGLLSSIGHFEFKRIVKSLTLNPYFYLQDFLKSLIFLNPFMAVASIAGIIKFLAAIDALKSKRKMLSILLLFYIPLIGTISPMVTPVFQVMRFIQNIVPLLILMAISGLFWQSNSLTFRTQKIIIITLLSLSSGAAILLIADDYIVHSLGQFLLQSISRMNGGDYEGLTYYVRQIGIGSIIWASLVLGAVIIISEPVQRLLNRRQVKRWVLTSILGYSLIALLLHSSFYAKNVKNINEVDKAAGLFIRNLPLKSRNIAVSDIGAIGYYSNTKILDLKGLISPEISLDMIKDDSLAFDYLCKSNQVDYIVIAPIWFKHIPKRIDILKRIKVFAIDDNTILAGDTTIVYQPEWPKE